MSNKILITAKNLELSRLRRYWGRPEFTPDDGIGSLTSLDQASDAIVAVLMNTQNEDKFAVIGSGVMVAPGVVLTATHVLEEFPPSGPGPIFVSFLPNNAGRVWLPAGTVTCSGPSQFNAIEQNRKTISDISIASCELHSDAQINYPLSMIPMEVCLPIPSQRLWAIGFRQGQLDDDATPITPLVSSGLVTCCYTNGRGDRMPSPCVEVNMECFGGMSGGPVLNEDGRVVGIVSSSYDDGPSYVTLIWDALRLSIDGLPQSVWPDSCSSLVGGIKHNLVRVVGNFSYDENNNITLMPSSLEMEHFTRPDTNNV